MCGIIGIVSYREISDTLVDGLKRLEYRGYDSAGLAVIDDKSGMKRLRVQGKVQSLADALTHANIKGNTGIAHTRWATHGIADELNAHPHVSNNEIALVHNGIIENYEQLRLLLVDNGYEFYSQTDTEVAAHLIHYYYQQNQDLLKAVVSAAEKMQGAFSLGVIHNSNSNELIGIRKGSPLVVGIGDDEHFIASDTLALSPLVNSVVYLNEGEIVRLTSNGIEIFDSCENTISPKPQKIDDATKDLQKGNYRHYMLKEIFEQSMVLKNLVDARVTNLKTLHNSYGKDVLNILDKTKNIHIIACGTSYHAGLIAKYWIESLAAIPVQVEIASEYRYRDIVVGEDTIFITVSQSGETADTIAALNKAKSLDYLTTFAICNVANSTLVRETDHSFLTLAGTEIGVASTKAFTTQLATFLMLACTMCKDQRAEEVLKELQNLSQSCEKVLTMNDEIEKLSALFVQKNHALFLGRGVQYPVAMEGALKLKEISYIHAEAYPAGELKHGPLALVDEHMPVFAVAPNNELLDKLKSNLNEVSARGGQLFVFVDDAKAFGENGAQLIRVPVRGHWVAPILYTIPLQLLAYHVASVKGTDVDQPRNLAKSVTVE